MRCVASMYICVFMCMVFIVQYRSSVYASCGIVLGTRVSVI